MGFGQEQESGISQAVEGQGVGFVREEEAVGVSELEVTDLAAVRRHWELLLELENGVASERVEEDDVLGVEDK